MEMTMGAVNKTWKATVGLQRVATNCAFVVLMAALALVGMSGSAWADPEITFYNLNYAPINITTGPDSNIWLTEGSAVSKITTAGVETDYKMPYAGYFITSGPDGNLWVTDDQHKIISKVTTSGVQTIYTPTVAPDGIVKGGDGNLWFVSQYDKQVGKITTDGKLSYYSLPASSNCLGFGPAITRGPDGNLWFTGWYKKSDQDLGGEILKITTSGEITEYLLGASKGIYIYPADITSGPDGNLWFTSMTESKIGKISTSGSVTVYSLTGNAQPRKIASGSDGNLWFTELSHNIGKISTSGEAEHYSLGIYAGYGITSGPDGNIWITTVEGNSTLAVIAKIKITADPLASSGKFLIWQNTSTGEMRWWNMATTGQIISSVEDIGHGKVSDETLGSEWRFAGTTTLGGVKTLFYQNTSTGKVKYWMLNSAGKLTSSGYVSENLKVNTNWKAAGVKTLNGTPTIIWQNQASGKVVYWLLETTGKLKSEVQNTGWGLVADSLTVNSNWRLSGVTTLSGTNVLLWQNQNNGKIVYWKLDSANKLVNATQNGGWGFVSSLTLASQWRQVGIVNSNGLVWQGQSYGKIAWWLLGDDAKLTSTTKDSGWGYVSDNLTLNSSWSLGAVSELGGVKTFLWHNPSTGKAAYWKINSSIKLQNETKNSGWGFVSDTLGMSGNWTLNCITD
jgi:streptogramin lyase